LLRCERIVQRKLIRITHIPAGRRFRATTWGRKLRNSQQKLRKIQQSTGDLRWPGVCYYQGYDNLENNT